MRQQTTIPARRSAMMPVTTSQGVTTHNRQPRDEDDEQWPPRMPATTRRYYPQAPVVVEAPRRLRRRPSTLALTLVLLICMGIGMALTAIIPPLWQRWSDDRTYGMPRTYQTDENVGHGDPNNPVSHFIALNNNGVLEVVEIPGGDPRKYQPQLYIIATLVGDGSNLVPLTVSFKDVNGDSKLDLLATYNGTVVVLLNNGKTFGH